MAKTRTIVQEGAPSGDLVVYAHMSAPYVAKQAVALAGTAFAVELRGAGTAAYRGMVTGAGGWGGYVAEVAAECGHAFRRTVLVTWSAGSQAAMEAAASADPPDVTVMLDGLYAGEDPAPGPRRVVWNEGLRAVADLAVRAARGERTARGVDRQIILFHSAIPTTYSSSGECARAVRGFVEEQLGARMSPATDVPAALVGRFTEALALGGLRIVAFPGADAAEHVREAHLWDEAARLFAPWLFEATTSAAAAPALPPGARLLRVTSPMLHGDDVRAWQGFLRGQGAEVDVDGVYGPKTAKKTQWFQTAAALEATGALDAPTLAAAMTMGFQLPVPAAAKAQGVDVSHHQGRVPWPAVFAAGGRFAFFKATEGAGWRDDRFQENAGEARAAGLYGSAYHYFLPPQDPAAQAKNFRDAALGRVVMPPANDFETLGGVRPALAVARARAFMEATEDAWGKRSMLYTYTAFWQSLLDAGALDDDDLDFFAARDLWLADYRARPVIPAPWKSWRFLQFDGDGGLTLPNGVDADFNVFAGDEAALRQWVGAPP